MRPFLVIAVVLYACSAGLGAVTYDASTFTLTYGSASDLNTVIDPPGMADAQASFGLDKAAFQALNPQVVGFDSAPGVNPGSAGNLKTVVATYNAGKSIQFNLPAAMYHYGGKNSQGRSAFSGSATYCDFSTIETQPTIPGQPLPTSGSWNAWLDVMIDATAAGGEGVSALGFCVCSHNIAGYSSGPGTAFFVLSDGTTASVDYPKFGGDAAIRAIFIGYQAPAGLAITRVVCTRPGSGNSFIAIDDLSFVVSDLSVAPPPATITNLAASDPAEASVTLTWTAPGDSASTGTAASYDIRYSASTITAANFSSAAQVSSPPAPAPAGTSQGVTVTGLSAYTTYFFAIKTTSHAGAVSALSNVPSCRTAVSSNDTTPPTAVMDLAASDATYTAVTLNWTAPSDPNSPCTAYDIRYSTSTIADANWASATPVAGVPAPHAPGTGQYFVVTGLATDTTYSFAIKTMDQAGNVSALSTVAGGTTQAAPPQANKRLLRQSDFRYKGYYRVQCNSDGLSELNYGQGFTHRYVNGQLRFLAFSFFGNVPGGGHHLIEFAAPAALGSTVTTRTNHWPDIMGSTGLGTGNGVWMGLWYEQARNRLWTTWAIDYPDDVMALYTKSLVVRTLHDDGTVSNVAGPWGLSGVQQRRIYGGVTALPQWFQDLYQVGPYAVGWGGYASRMGLGVSMGPTFYAMAEPTAYPAGDIPTSGFKTLMDHSSGTLGADWYASGRPTSFDRGVRNGDVRNDYDTPNWQSPAPDGLGRWTWGDSNWNTGTWIETATGFGFITVPKLCNGRTWYQTSTLHCERQSAEIQVFDPRMLGEVAQGARASWNTHPASRWEITSDCTPLGLMWGRSGNGPDGGPCGASYDPTTQQLYVYCVGGNSLNSYILVYDVGPLLGDVDGDGHVDVVDLLYLADSWGKVAGETGFNPLCDFNADDSVDVSDLLMLADNWGL